MNRGFPMQLRIGVPIQEFAMLYPSPLDYRQARVPGLLGTAAG